MGIERDELADAERELEDLGYDVGDFLFTPVDYANLSLGPAPIIADVVVENTVVGVKRTYEASSGSSWPVAFITDLRAGVFGPPGGREA
jgi:hypothetical protein